MKKQPLHTAIKEAIDRNLADALKHALGVAEGVSPEDWDTDGIVSEALSASAWEVDQLVRSCVREVELTLGGRGSHEKKSARILAGDGN